MHMQIYSDDTHLPSVISLSPPSFFSLSPSLPLSLPLSLLSIFQDTHTHNWTSKRPKCIQFMLTLLLQRPLTLDQNDSLHLHAGEKFYVDTGFYQNQVCHPLPLTLRCTIKNSQCQKKPWCSINISQCQKYKCTINNIDVRNTDVLSTTVNVRKTAEEGNSSLISTTLSICVSKVKVIWMSH